MPLLNYFLFVLLVPLLGLSHTPDLVAMQTEICKPGFRLLIDLYSKDLDDTTCQTTAYEESSDEDTDDECYQARHKPYELEEKAEGKAFSREQSARIRAERKRLMTCSSCKTIHVIPETEDFSLIQSNPRWTCNDIYWQEHKLFVDGVAVCAATQVTLELEKKGRRGKENKRPRKSNTRVINWILCTHCSTWRRLPSELIKSGKIDIKELERKSDWVCADATWKGPKGLACKR
ncbi:hypothetical protein JST56_07430 [Candidatus Dependentiae bacterium]|nr:hypothetical protein [Candidatus Dependentiae bacterium]